MTDKAKTIVSNTVKTYVVSALSLIMLASIEAIRTDGDSRQSILRLREDVSHLQAQVARIDAKLTYDPVARR